jgi:peptidoglycan/LPS O-acetylase OafA/YrhL
MSFLFYFGLGIYTKDHFEQIKKGIYRLTPLLLIISLALTIGASFFIIIGFTMGYPYYSIPPYYFIGLELIYPILKISTFLLLLNIATSLVGKRSICAKVVNKFGDYSFAIYLIHIFINQIAIRILKNNTIDYNNWLFYPSVFLVTVVFSYLTVRLISYIPFSNYIIGHRKNGKTLYRA